MLEAADGVEALEVAAQHPGPIHLLLPDWCMPRLDGEGLIGRLSNGRPQTAILVMTGYMIGDFAAHGYGSAQTLRRANIGELGRRGAPRAVTVAGVDAIVPHGNDLVICLSAITMIRMLAVRRSATAAGTVSRRDFTTIAGHIIGFRQFRPSQMGTALRA